MGASRAQGAKVEFTTVAAFWAVSFLFVMTPGADWAYAITAGLRHRSVLPAVTGLLGGHLVATVVVAAGVAALVAGTPLVLTALTAVGAGYLVWLGIGTLARQSAPHATGELAIDAWVRQALRGLAISRMNPKVLLLFLALLPQFTHPTAGFPVAMQILALGSVPVASCAVVYTAVGFGARWVLQARPRAARTVSRFSGAAMVGIGTLLLVEQVVS